MPGNPIERTKGVAARFALASFKRPKFADGGPVVGPLLGADPGRTDTRPMSVPAGSFVIPADIVSGLPSAEGNSLAGHTALAKLFSSLPLSPDEAPYGASTPKLPRGRTMPGLVNPHRLMESAMASGGEAKGADHEHVPIVAADGEFVVAPEFVKRLGLGNLKRGHEILDQFVDEVRKKNIKTLQKLPSTVKDGTK